MLLIRYINNEGNSAVGVLAEDKELVHEVKIKFDIYELLKLSLNLNVKLTALVNEYVSKDTISYSSLEAEGRLLMPISHPDPAHIYLTGTGLTHIGSASSRDDMHKDKTDSEKKTETDSMRMFKMGLKGGKPTDGTVGAQPEWFYKGNGNSLVAPNKPLNSPSFAMDGGEEAEIAVIYIIDENGDPYRVGYALGNEFSDHVMEKQNYLWLAHSKLRQAAIGPALFLGDFPQNMQGFARVIGPNGNLKWEKQFLSGEENMSHTLENLEYHHFKYDIFRQPGDIHIHFLGTATLSYTDNIKVVDGDTFEIEASIFGPSLKNKLITSQPLSIVVNQL